MTPYGIPEGLWLSVQDIIIGCIIAGVILGIAALQQQEDQDNKWLPDLPLPPELWMIAILMIILWWRLIVIFMLAHVVSEKIRR